MVKLVLSSSISLKAAEPISRHQLRTYYIPLQRNVHQPTSSALRFSAEVVSHTALINPYFPQKLSGTPNPGKLFSENATATQNQYGDHPHHLTPPLLLLLTLQLTTLPLLPPLTPQISQNLLLPASHKVSDTSQEAATIFSLRAVAGAEGTAFMHVPFSLVDLSN